MVDEQRVGVGAALADGHLQGVLDELGAHVRRELPADDHAAVAVDDEAEEHQALPAADVGEVRAALLIGPLGAEVAIQQIRRRDGSVPWIVVRHGRPRRLAPTIALAAISRSTWQRGAVSPRRSSSRHIRRDP